MARVVSMSVVVAMSLAGGAISPWASATVGPTTATEADDQRYQDEGNALMDEGEAHQAAGAHAEAARVYAKAFDAFAKRSKSDAKETQAVSLAVDEFKTAQDAQPRNLVLLEEEAILLERFVAHAKDRRALPEGMEEEFQRVQGTIEMLKQELDEEQRRHEERRRQEQQGKQPEAERHEQAEPEQRRDAETTNERPRRMKPDQQSRREAATILGSGVAGILGGTVFIAVGVWTFGAADDRRDAQLTVLDASEFPDEASIREHLDEWHRRGRGIATGFMVGGAVLAGVGVGLVSWGAIRLRRSGRATKKRASIVLPMLAADGVGVLARVPF